MKMNPENEKKLSGMFERMFTRSGDEELAPARPGATPLNILFSTLPNGIEVGDGWYNPIHRLCETVFFMSFLHGLDPYFYRIERCGMQMQVGIRFRNLREEDQEHANEVLKVAKTICAKTCGICEVCGHPASQTSEGDPLCERCEQLERI